MANQYANNFEAPAGGVAITRAGSAVGGTVFGAVAANSGTVNYDSTHPAHGSRSALFSTGGSAGSPQVSYVFPALSALAAVRIYAYVPTGNTPPTGVVTIASTATVRAKIALSSGNVITVLDSTGTTVGTFVTAMPRDAQFRIEAEFSLSTVGSFAARLYTSMDSATPAEAISGASTNFGGTADTVNFGICDSLANIGPVWLDNIACNDVKAVIGPFVSSVTTKITGTEGLVRISGSRAWVPLPAFARSGAVRKEPQPSGVAARTTGQLWPQ